MKFLYVLNDADEPVPEPDVRKWATWFQRNNEHRRIAYDDVGDISVATVFLGVAMSSDGAPLLLYETGCYPGGVQNLYSTRAEAVAGHARVVARLIREPQEKR